MNATTGRLIMIAMSMTAVGCSRPARAPAPAHFAHEEFHEQGLRRFWDARLPLEPGEAVLRCSKLAETLFCTTNHSAVFALDARAGVITWSRRVGTTGDLVFPPTMSVGSGLDQAVALTSQSRVGVVDRATGETIAGVELPFGAAGPAVASDELIWVGGLDGLIYAQFPNGYNHWRFQTGGAITAAPILLPDRLIFASQDGYVYCATPIDKQRIWVFDADAPVVATPGFRDDRLYVPSKDRRLYCVDAETGELIWQHLTSEPLVSSPQVTFDTVYQHCGAAGLLAVDRDSGAQRWILPEGVSFVARHGEAAYVTDVSGRLLEVDNRTGDVRDRLYVPNLELAAANTEDAGIYVASRDGFVTCLQPLNVPYLRSGEIAAALRRARPGAGDGGDDEVAQPVDAAVRQPARDPLQSESKVPPLVGRSGG